MKTEWKWNFVTLMALAFSIGLQALLGLACMVYIYPRITYAYHLLNQPLPDMIKTSIRFHEILVDEWILPLLLIVILVAWFLFERRYKKEGKANVRLAAFAVICAATTLYFAVVSLSALIPTAAHLAPRATLALNSTFRIRSAPMLELKLNEADMLVSELSDACEREDWDAIHLAAHDVEVITSSVTGTGPDNLAKLMGRAGPSGNSELERLLLEVDGDGAEVFENARSQNLPAIREHLAALKESLGQLRKALEL